MPQNVPSSQSYPDVAAIQDPVTRDVLTKFWALDDDFKELVALWINTAAVSRVLATNVAVPMGAGSVTVTFAVAQPDTSYEISAELGWNTAWWVTAKLKTSFTLNFGTAAPASAVFSWSLFR